MQFAKCRICKARFWQRHSNVLYPEGAEHAVTFECFKETAQGHYSMMDLFFHDSRFTGQRVLFARARRVKYDQRQLAHVENANAQ